MLQNIYSRILEFYLDVFLSVLKVHLFPFYQHKIRVVLDFQHHFILHAERTKKP